MAEDQRMDDGCQKWRPADLPKRFHLCDDYCHVYHDKDLVLLQTNLSLVDSKMKMASEILHKISSGKDGFPLFPKFPSEIRIKIWECYLRDNPRIVQLDLAPYAVHLPMPEWLADKRSKEYSPTPVPALLHVNQETRHEALNAYTRIELLGTRCFYMNLEIDTAYIRPLDIDYVGDDNVETIFIGDAFSKLRIRDTPTAFRSSLRNIAFEINNHFVPEQYAYYVKAILRDFENIEETTLVSQKGDNKWFVTDDATLLEVWDLITRRTIKGTAKEEKRLASMKKSIGRWDFIKRADMWEIVEHSDTEWRWSADNVRTYKRVDDA